MDNQVEDEEEPDHNEESDHDEESGESDGDDSLSDLASSHGSDDDEEKMAVKEKKIRKKNTSDQTAKNDEIPFVFKGSF